MQYLHTRTHQKISDIELLLTVENLEAGYYVPDDLPELLGEDLEKLAKLSFTERFSKLLLAFFPSFSATDIEKCVKKQFLSLNQQAQTQALNDFMPVYLAELDRLATGSIYDYILPLLLALQNLAITYKNKHNSSLQSEACVLLEHNLGNSSFAALVNAISENAHQTEYSLYYNPKRIKPQIERTLRSNVPDNCHLYPVDNALSLPTVSLFASRLKKIQAQISKQIDAPAQTTNSHQIEKQNPTSEIISNSKADAINNGDNSANLLTNLAVTNNQQLDESAQNFNISMEAYPQASASSLDSLPAVMIATALQLALIAELPLNEPEVITNDAALDLEHKSNPKARNKKSTHATNGNYSNVNYGVDAHSNTTINSNNYRPINLFLPAKQGYQLLAACYCKVICPLINKLYLAGIKNNLLCELFQYGRYEVKGKQTTFELPVQLERMLFELVGRDSQKSLDILHNFAKKGCLQLPLAAKQNISGLIVVDTYSPRAESKLMLEIYDRFDLLLAPLSVLAFASYLKHYEVQQHKKALALVFINASIYRYFNEVVNAVLPAKDIKAKSTLQIALNLALESGQKLPNWFIREQQLNEAEIKYDDRFEPESHKAEFEKIRFEGLSAEDIAKLF